MSSSRPGRMPNIGNSTGPAESNAPVGLNILPGVIGSYGTMTIRPDTCPA